MDAADGLNSATVTLVYGQKKQKITVSLPPEEPGGVIMVRHLATEVAKVTDIPCDRQRLIFKGTTLKDPKQTLKDAGLKDGCKVLLLSGCKTDFVEDKSSIRLRELETEINTMSSKLSDTIHELDSTARGQRLNAADCVNVFDKLIKDLSRIDNQLGLLMESLDALPLPENAQAFRDKRRSLVVIIQELQKKTDEVSDRISERIARREQKPIFL